MRRTTSPRFRISILGSKENTTWFDLLVTAAFGTDRNDHTESLTGEQCTVGNVERLANVPVVIMDAHISALELKIPVYRARVHCESR